MSKGSNQSKTLVSSNISLSAIKNIEQKVYSFYIEIHPFNTYTRKYFESKLYFPGLFILMRQQILFIQYSNEATCHLVYDFLSLMIGWS